MISLQVALESEGEWEAFLAKEGTLGTYALLACMSTLEWEELARGLFCKDPSPSTAVKSQLFSFCSG